jgi:hypothetical protein
MVSNYQLPFPSSRIAADGIGTHTKLAATRSKYLVVASATAIVPKESTRRQNYAKNTAGTAGQQAAAIIQNGIRNPS